MNSEQKLQ
jgi:hypothetical protein